MQNMIGIALSMAYILLVLAVATVIARINKGATEKSRKLVHILVGNWVFITPMFTELWAVLLVPFSFIIINSLSLKYKLIPAMERNDDSLGTVYYAISMFVLSGAGFILGWKTLPFIGLLIMAYGDGLAAIAGKRWGLSKPFSFAPQKTLVGSAVVAVAAFIITAGCIFAFASPAQLEVTGWPMVLVIAAATAVFSAFIELTGSKGCDNLILPIGSGLFATLCLYFGSMGFYLYLCIAAAILIFAYKLRAITPDGIVAALLTAATLYALGGMWIGASLLVFFILGSGVSRLRNSHKQKAEQLQELGGPRNWKQVLCNSLPACVLLWISVFYPQPSLLLLSFGVFCAAAADTFSSELGMMSKGKVYNILNGKPMQRGLSGGVSLTGLAAGLTGSLLLAILALPEFGWKGVIFVGALGFLGSVIDSILGAAFQRKYLGTGGEMQDRPHYHNEQPLKGYNFITNSAVNLISLSLVSLCGHLVYFMTFLPK